MTFLLSALLAHLVADFVLQPEETIQSKGPLAVKRFSMHGVLNFLCSALALHLYGSHGIVVAAAIAVSHVLIDWLRSFIDRGRDPFRRLLFFSADQCAHIGTLIALWEAGPMPAPVVGYGVGFLPATFAAIRPVIGRLTLDEMLLVANGYVFAVFSGAAIVRLVLDCFDLPFDPDLETRSGRYIGMLERALMVTLTMAGSVASIAFVIAAKSLARFRQLSEFRFGEYYLIGTMSSTLIALSTGLVMRAVLALM